jgi:hypothetical protein
LNSTRRKSFHCRCCLSTLREISSR